MRAMRRENGRSSHAPYAAACALLCAASISPAQSLLVDLGLAFFFSGPVLAVSPDANGKTWNNDRCGQAIRPEADERWSKRLNAVEPVVEEAPPLVFFTRQPSAVIADGGGGITLEAAAQSDGPGLAIRWERDGVPVVDGERVSGAGSGTLVISGARLEDAGLYRAVATNGPTEVVSDAAVVAVRWSDEDAADADANGSLDFFDVLRFLRSSDEVSP